MRVCFIHPIFMVLSPFFFFYARITLRRSVAFEITYTQQPTCRDILYIETRTEGRYIFFSTITLQQYSRVTAKSNMQNKINVKKIERKTNMYNIYNQHEK